jgi:6-phosphogluconolactonase (cycloisomerase 2 family)
VQLPGASGCESERRREGCLRAKGLGEASSVALSPDGRSLYVASNGSNAVAVFRRDPRHGALHQLRAPDACVAESGQDGCAMGRGLVGAFSVAVAPDGRNVYVASFQGVAAFSRAPATGALKQLSGSAACVALRGMDGCAAGRALDAAASVTVSPDGHNVYVASSGSNAVAVFSRDPRTGEISQLSGLAGCTSEGATEGCQQGNALRGAFSVTVSPDGRFAYVGALYSSSIASFERDPIDGELAQIPGAGHCTTEGGFEDCATGRGMNGVNHVAVSPDGGYIYAAASGSSSVAALFRTRSTGGIDQLKGRDACTSEGGREGCTPGRGLGGAVALAISPDGRSLYVAGLNSVAILARNRSSGVLAQLSGTHGCATEIRGQDRCAAARGLAGASSVAISPDGRFVYVASLNSGAVAVFARAVGPPKRHHASPGR